MRAACRLRRRAPRPLQRGRDRQPEMPRQLARLVEAARALARSVQRHGDGEVGALEHPRAGAAHPPRQMARERRTAVVLEGVHDRAQRAFVQTDRPRQRDERLVAAASRTARVREADAAPRRQRIAAGAAAGFGDRDDGGPAGGADGAGGGMIERPAARRADRRQQEREQAVGDGERQPFSLWREEARRTPRSARRPPTDVRASRNRASAA